MHAGARLSIPLAKPDFLSAERATAFEERDIAETYRHRPTYSDAVFDTLTGLICTDGPILDIGCGTGFLARPLAARDWHVDAIDISEAMVDVGRGLTDGDRPNLNWQAAPFETAKVAGPYALAVAGESLHWMDWPHVLPKIANLLMPSAHLAIVDNRVLALPWQADLVSLIARYSTSQTYRAYDTAQELTVRGLFTELGRERTQPDPVVQSIDDYVASFHARASFSRTQMGKAAAAFDEALREAIVRTGETEVVIERVTEIVWGLPS